VLGPAHSAARPEGVRHQLGLLETADDELDERSEVRGVEGAGQRSDVRGRQRVAPGQRVDDPIIRHEDPGHRLLFQPLAGVPLGGAGARGQLGGREGIRGERPVVAEAVAEIHRLQVEGAEDRAEQALDEGVGRGGVGSAGQ
jgi:hypothetical protein